MQIILLLLKGIIGTDSDSWQTASNFQEPVTEQPHSKEDMNNGQCSVCVQICGKCFKTSNPFLDPFDCFISINEGKPGIPKVGTAETSKDEKKEIYSDCFKLCLGNNCCSSDIQDSIEGCVKSIGERGKCICEKIVESNKWIGECGKKFCENIGECGKCTGEKIGECGKFICEKIGEFGKCTGEKIGECRKFICEDILECSKFPDDFEFNGDYCRCSDCRCCYCDGHGCFCSECNPYNAYIMRSTLRMSLFSGCCTIGCIICQIAVCCC